MPERFSPSPKTCGRGPLEGQPSSSELAANLRGSPYDLTTQEIVRRATEAWERGATEVCMQGGIHPYYTGHTYLDICRMVKEACPGMHVHAFSPLEVSHGAKTLGLSLRDFLAEAAVDLDGEVGIRKRRRWTNPLSHLSRQHWNLQSRCWMTDDSFCGLVDANPRNPIQS